MSTQQQSTAVAVRDETAIAKQELSLAIERLVVMGDLSQLTPDQRVAHYKATCQATGVDWIGRPFDYILVDAGGGQKKLVLYANQNCASQIRDARNVSVKILSREKVGDLYIVTALASLPSGRAEEATGAVPIAVEEGEWKTSDSGKKYFRGNGQFKEIRGTDLANALMRCETKAKRRATFNLCGLGAFADEPQGEVVDVDIRSGKEVEPDTREKTVHTQIPMAASPRFHTSNGPARTDTVIIEAGVQPPIAPAAAAEAEPIEDTPEADGPSEVEPGEHAPAFEFPERLHAVLRQAVSDISEKDRLEWSPGKAVEEFNRLAAALATRKWSRDGLEALLWALHLAHSGEILPEMDTVVDYADPRFYGWIRADAKRLPILAEVAEWVRLNRG